MSIFLKKFLIFCALTVIAVRPSTAADSLVVSPANPTIMDSIRLNIVIKERACYCISPFVHDSTAVILPNDSTITLSYAIDTPLTLCYCFALPPYPVLPYKRGPLPAGNYSVYEEYNVCTGLSCLQDSLTVTKALIGKFTVSQQAAVLFRQKPATMENIGKMSGNVSVYDIRGALVSSNLTAAPKRTSGVYFIKPNGRQVVKMKLLY
jgi:hypothetical protein